MRPNPAQTPTIGNRLATGIYDTLADNLHNYMSRSDLHGVNYHLQPEEVTAATCPDVGIYDLGWTKQTETIRGYDALGVLQPGLAQRRYRFNIVVHVVGRKVEETGRKLNVWADAIVACLEDYFQLDDLAVEVFAESTDPSVPISMGSDIMRAIAVEAIVNTWTLQGAVAFA